MRKTLAALWPYLRKHKGKAALGMGALIAKDVLGILNPLVIRAGVDSLQAGFRIETVFWLAAALVGISAIKGYFQYWMRVILIGVSRDVEFEIRNDLFQHLISLSSGFYSRYRTGDIMARSTSDLNAVRMMAGPGIMYFTETGLTFVLAVVVMLSVDWRLALFALIPAPLVSVAVIYFGGRIHERFEEIQKLFADISSRVQENLAGVRLVRAYAQEDAEIAQFEKLNRGYIAENVKLARVSGLFMPLLEALIGFTFLIVLWAGGSRMLAGKLSIGGFVMFNTYMGMLIWPMIAMGWVVNLVQRGSASLKRINEMLAEPAAIAAPASPRPIHLVRGEIELRGVTMTYESGKALDGVTLRIPAGETVAIAGHTGAGKTTAAQLIPRLIDPSEGQVLLDGVDVREFDPRELRAQIGMVPQETFLFSSTVRENIAFGVERATEEEILRAVRIAGLASDIASFPMGLDTVVGERGITLSGGQKQRTAIARAVLRNPPVLILDDALASVDTVTEEQILRELSEVMRGRTTILISHRVSTIRHASRIFVIEDGKLAEEGSHEELLAAGGYYADLHQKQLLEEELEAIF